MSSKACQLPEVHLYQKPLKSGVYEGVWSAVTSEHGEIGGQGKKTQPNLPLAKKTLSAGDGTKMPLVNLMSVISVSAVYTEMLVKGKKPVKYRVLACVWKN